MAAVNPGRRAAGALLFALGVTVPAADAALLRIDPSGRGEVLIYPYYTVRGGLASLVTLHNDSERVKAVRFRVRETLNGRSVLALNLYLRPYETWTAAISEGVDGPELAAGTASCSVAAAVSPALDEQRWAFTNADYTGARRDHPESVADTHAGIDRARTGLIEAIDMGSLVAGDGVTELADEVLGAWNDAGALARDCAALVAAWEGPWSVDPALSIDPPVGALGGSIQIVDVASGALFAVAATALSGFHANADAPGALHAAAGSAWPDLTGADHGGFVDVEVLGHAEPVRVPLDPDAANADAVSLALLTGGMINRVNADPLLEGQADFVVTFPTRHYYTDTAAASTGSTLFDDPFQPDGASCTVVPGGTLPLHGIAPPAQRTGCIGTPPPPPRLCASADTFVPAATGGVTSGPLADPRPPGFFLGPGAPQYEGTAGVAFRTGSTHCDPAPGADPVLEVGGIVWAGLPAIGFVAQGYRNNQAQPGRVATYDATLSHRRRPPEARQP